MEKRGGHGGVCEGLMKVGEEGGLGGEGKEVFWWGVFGLPESWFAVRVVDWRACGGFLVEFAAGVGQQHVP